MEVRAPRRPRGSDAAVASRRRDWRGGCGWPGQLLDPFAAQLAREPRASAAPDLGGKVGPADGATVATVLVAHVDAAHERDALVDEEELAMIARQRAEKEPPAPGVDADRAAGGDQLRLDLARILRRAPSVERDAHGNAAGRGGR
jgi:hypothetical protein